MQVLIYSLFFVFVFIFLDGYFFGINHFKSELSLKIELAQVLIFECGAMFCFTVGIIRNHGVETLWHAFHICTCGYCNTYVTSHKM